MAGIIWLDGIEGSYHDGSCPCGSHCRNCFDDLPRTRAVRDQMIADGRIPAGDRLHPLARYCSPYCKGRAKRERRLDRDLAAMGQS